MADETQKDPGADLPDKDKDPQGYWRAFYKREAEAAFHARDEAKAAARALAEKTLSEDDRALFERLRADQAKADEQRKMERGQFDALKAELVTKHQTELATREKALADLRTQIETTEVRQAFFSASEWFGDAGSEKTILPAELAYASLKQYIQVQPVDLGDGTTARRLVVSRPDGSVIHGRDGAPAPFIEAIGELIDALPYRARILRGSGKTGSGSSGGTTTTTSPIDLTTVTPEQLKDPKIREAVKRRQAGIGSMVFGESLQR